MPFQIIRNDITKVEADVIVNTANPEPVIGGGTDSAIYQAAGRRRLMAARRKIGAIQPGQCAVTPAFRLKAKHIIHTVGPVWIDGNHGEREILRSCYAGSLAAAAELGAESIAFPLIATGVYGFPKDEALNIALAEIGRFLLTHEMRVILVVFDRQAFELSGTLVGEIDEYIDEHGVREARNLEYGTEDRRRGRETARSMREPAFLLNSEAVYDRIPTSFREAPCEMSVSAAPDLMAEDFSDPTYLPGRGAGEESVFAAPGLMTEDDFAEVAPSDFEEDGAPPPPGRPRPMVDTIAMPKMAPVAAAKPAMAAGKSLDEMLDDAGESFQQKLFELIDESGMDDISVYKKANIDRKVFSRIRRNEDYHPKKRTAVAFAIALELDMPAMQDLLSRAELALSPSSKFDLIITYFVTNRIYDIYEINAALFKYGQPILGE